MLIAGFDTETTGLDVEKDYIVQVGCVLWDTEAKVKKAKVKMDHLINYPGLAEIDPAASGVNGITKEDLEKYGSDATYVFSALNCLLNRADAVLAHNGNTFDRPIYENSCKRLHLEPVSKLWIDSTCDIDFPAPIQTRKLSHLACEHGFLNPFPHDAISDVLTMLKIADMYDWEKTLAFSKAPTILVKAETSFHQKELAKKLSFRWDAPTKSWIKSVKDFQLEALQKAASEAGFKITLLKGAQ